MNISSCPDSDDTFSDVTLLLIGRVLPYLLQGLLFGGESPFILHIADLSFNKYRKGKRRYLLCIHFNLKI